MINRQTHTGSSTVTAVRTTIGLDIRYSIKILLKIKFYVGQLQ